MTTYNIYADNNETLATATLTKSGKYWFLTVETVRGPVFAGTFKTKAKAEEYLNSICANGLSFLKWAVGVA